jgi:hypothetical protein
MSDTVNGWRNRATWLVNLHGFTEGITEDFDFTDDRDADIDTLADQIESMVEDYIEENTAGLPVFIRDLLIDGFDWRELAEAAIDDSDHEYESEVK